jgi:hypothetical protein
VEPPTEVETSHIQEGYTGIAVVPDESDAGAYTFGVFVDGDILAKTDRVSEADKFIDALGVPRSQTLAEEMEEHL